MTILAYLHIVHFLSNPSYIKRFTIDGNQSSILVEQHLSEILSTTDAIPQ